jgi:hypothetical protein
MRSTILRMSESHKRLSESQMTQMTQMITKSVKSFHQRQSAILTKEDK